jgi:hypothetical protein
MANRAYLFATDREEAWDPDLSGSALCYDSRHTVPIAWRLLFEPDEVRVVELEWNPPIMGTRKRKAVRLRADRARALERFLRRRPLPERILSGRVDPRPIGRWRESEC